MKMEIDITLHLTDKEKQILTSMVATYRTYIETRNDIYAVGRRDKLSRLIIKLNDATGLKMKF